jgi:hypothetical protein
VSVRFKVPAIAAFDVGRMDESGNNHQVSRVFPLDPNDPTALSSIQRQKKEKGKKSEDPDVFVGAINKTFYLLSEKYSDLTGIASTPSSPAAVGASPNAMPSGLPPSPNNPHESGSTDVAIVDSSSCVPGSPIFPACIVGSHKLEKSVAVATGSRDLFGASRLGWSFIGNKFYIIAKVLFGLDLMNLHEIDQNDSVSRSFIQMFAVAGLSLVVVIVSAMWMQVKGRLEPKTVKKVRSQRSFIHEAEVPPILPEFTASSPILSTVPMHGIKTLDMSSESVLSDADVNKPLPQVSEADSSTDAAVSGAQKSDGTLQESNSTTVTGTPSKKKKKKSKGAKTSKDGASNDQNDENDDPIESGNEADPLILPNTSPSSLSLSNSFSLSSGGSTLVDGQPSKISKDEAALQTIKVTDTILGMCRTFFRYSALPHCNTILLSRSWKPWHYCFQRSF